MTSRKNIKIFDGLVDIGSTLGLTPPISVTSRIASEPSLEKALKARRRKAEKTWRSNKTQETLLKFHEARNVYVNSLKAKITTRLSNLVSESRGNSKK